MNVAMSPSKDLLKGFTGSNRPHFYALTFAISENLIFGGETGKV